MKTMKVDTEIISQQTIKPASPTPGRLRHYTQSLIDQITPQIFMPFCVFYPQDRRANLSNLERCDRIKKSLSEVLILFYPLARRVKENLYIDCNDEGVLYAESKANCQLSEFLENPILAELDKCLTYELVDVNELALAIQVTIFNCGGMVIGLIFNHKVSDACSFFFFLNSWAAIARGISDIQIPRFEFATLFPPETSPIFVPTRGKHKIVIKRFVFDASSIVAVRAKYSTDNNSNANPRPTRVEALSAFIWSRYLATIQPEQDPNKIYAVFHATNLRIRLDPPLSEQYFGNMNLSTASVVSWDSEIGFDSIIIPARDALLKVDKNYVKEFQKNGGQMKFLKENMEKLKKGEGVTLAFTSLCRFPVYEADFGWGKPVWVGSAKLFNKNVVTFLDTKSGNGIEAWINLEEEEMAKFEVDKQLLLYVSSGKVDV